MPYFRVKLLNVDIGTQAYLSLNTYLIPTPPSQVQVTGSTSTAITSPLDASGNVKVAVKNTIPISTTISGVVDVSGSVISTPALNPAQLRTLPLVVGHWYNIASIGDTIGAVWAEMGALVSGESLPPVGRQFQCLYGGYGTATCYDITAPVDGTASQVVDISGATFTGNDLNVNISNFTYGGTIPIGIDTDFNTVQLASTSSLPAGTNVLGLVGLDTTAGANTIAISQTGTQNNVAITGTVEISKINDPLPSGSNTIGVVGIDSSLNTVKIDPTYNEVKVNPTAQPPVRITGLGDAALSVGGPGLLYGLSYQNKSTSVNCWIKLYDSATTPTTADTPFLIQYLECVQQYNLSHNNDNCYNAPIANTLWVRASLLPDDNDSTDTDIDAEITAFVGS